MSTRAQQPVGSMAYVEMLLFGLSEAEGNAIEEEWRQKLGQIFR